MDSVRDTLRKLNQDRSKESNLTNSKESPSKLEKTLAVTSKERLPLKKIDITQQFPSGPDTNEAKVNFTNQEISTIFWRLHEYTQRSKKYSHLQTVFQIVTHPQVEALLKSFEENKTNSSLVCKVRLKSAADTVKKLLVSSSKWVASVTVCEEIAGKYESKCDCTLEEVSRWIEKVATLNEEVEKSYAKFVKQLNYLREDFRSVHRGKEVGGVPDIDGPMEDLARALSKENAYDSGKMLVMSSKWLLVQVNTVFNILDECCSGADALTFMNCSSSLNVNNNDTKGTRDRSQEKNMVKKIEVTKVDAEVQTEDEVVLGLLASSIPSVTKGSMSPPPIAHSTPRSSFSEGSNPLGKLEDLSGDQSSGGEEFRYKISSVQEMIAETYDRDAGGEKFRKVLDLLDDGTKTVKSSIVDLIVDKCPHLFN